MYANIVIFGLLILSLMLILNQINGWLKITKRIECKFGKHSHKTKENGKIVPKYRCQICNKAKKHPHLRVIQGHNRALRSNFKF